MPSPTVIYYGPAGLAADALDAFFCKLRLRFERVQTQRDLLTAVRRAPRPVVVLALSESPDVLMRLARQIIPDPSSAFPHVFILYDGEPFDAQLEAVTVLTGTAKLSRLTEHVYALLRA